MSDTLSQVRGRMEMGEREGGKEGGREGGRKEGRLYKRNRWRREKHSCTCSCTEEGMYSKYLYNGHTCE